MPKFNGNGAYLEWGGVNVSGWWTDDLSNERSANLEDVTAGAGTNYVQRAAGLYDGNISFAVIYDTDDIAIYKANLQEGTVDTLIYGPEGNVVGKPKLEGSMILESISQPQSINKEKVMFELSFSQADEPVTTLTGDKAGTF